MGLTATEIVDEITEAVMVARIVSVGQKPEDARRIVEQAVRDSSEYFTRVRYYVFATLLELGNRYQVTVEDAEGRETVLSLV